MAWDGVPDEPGLLCSRRVSGLTIFGIRFKDEHGRDVKRKIGPSKDAARQELQAAKKEVERRRMQVLRGLEEPGDGLTLGDLWRRYEPELKRKLSYGDDVRYAQVWLDYLGASTNINQIRPKDVRRWQRDQAKRTTRRGRPPSPATMNRHLSFLRRLFNMAIADELTTNQPVKRGTLGQENNRRTRWLAPEEEERLAAASPSSKLWLAIQVALWTGLRAGEQLRLRRADTDLERETITVRSSKGHEDEHLPLHPRAAELLRTAHDAHNEDRVFPWWSGVDTLNQAFQRLCDRAGVEAITWHDLRRTFCTRLALAGVPMEQIQRLARHATLEVTIQRYAHFSPENLRQALLRMEDGNKSGTVAKAVAKCPHCHATFDLPHGSVEP